MSADADVGVVPGEIDEFDGGRETDVDAGVRRAEAAQPRQPFGGERG